MSWLSELTHGHFNNPLGWGLGGLAAIAAPFLLPELAAGAGGLLGIGEAAGGAAAAGAEAGGALAATEAGGLGALTEAGVVAPELAGETALGFAPEATGLGSELSLESLTGSPLWGTDTLALSPTSGIMPAENIPSGFLEAGAGTPDSFYEAVGATGGTSPAAGGVAPAVDTASAASAGGYLDTGLVPQSSLDAITGVVPSADVSAGAPAAGSPAAAGLNTTATPSFWDKLVSGATGGLTKNPLGVAAAGGLLGYNILQGQKTSAAMKAIQGEAGQLGQQGQQLMQYLQSGTLPPGLQQGITNATSAMKARIIANHAKNGMSTDPSQNSALAQELNNVDLQAVALVAQEGEKLLQMGMNEAQISANLYTTLEKLNREQAASMGRAIAGMAMAMGGGPASLQLKLAG